MAQADYVIDNGPGAAVRRDINTHLAAIVTCNSGPTEPIPTYPGQLWLDTSYGANGYLKLRSQNNEKWINLFDADVGGFLPITGGTMTGNLTIASTYGWSALNLRNAWNGNDAFIHGMGTNGEFVNEIRFGFVTNAVRDAAKAEGKEIPQFLGWRGNPFTFNLQTGDMLATGDVRAYSDRRIKENVRPISDALDRVKEMVGVWFDHKITDRKSAGVIAQDFEKAAPELVTESSEGMKSVNYGGISAYLIEAIKELSAEVDSLRKQIAERADG
jgi:hypothetical protein